MEGQAQGETEKEEVWQEIQFLEAQIIDHEDKLNEIDLIQSQLLSSELKTTQEFQLLKKSLHRSIIEESEKLVELRTFQQEIISASSSEMDLNEASHAEETSQQSLLRKTQQELDQIYSTTESIMSTSSRLSKSLSRESQHLFLASAEPLLRNSVLISIENRLSSSAEKEDFSAESTEQDTSEDSNTSRSSPDYAVVKLRPKSVEVYFHEFKK